MEQPNLEWMATVKLGNIMHAALNQNHNMPPLRGPPCICPPIACTPQALNKSIEGLTGVRPPSRRFLKPQKGGTKGHTTGHTAASLKRTNAQVLKRSGGSTGGSKS